MRKLITGVVLMCTTLFCCAQVSVGVKAGGNLNHIFVNAPENLKPEITPMVSFHAGLFAMRKITSRFNMVGELQFSQRGFKEKFSQVSNASIKLNYIECNVLMSYAPVKQVGIEAGPTFAYQLSSTIDGNDADHIYDTDFDFGITGGVRVNITNRLSAIAHLYLGLTNIDDSTIANESVREFNRVTQLSIGYKISKTAE